MANGSVERRRAQRYPIEAKAIVRDGSGEAIEAISINISSNGVLLHVDRPSPLKLGEQVSVEIELPREPDKPLSVWAIGRVVRNDGARSAIELLAGNFDPFREQPDNPPAALDPNGKTGTAD